jgi:hypothetical protein
MIELRKLTKEEINQIIIEAESTETKFLLDFCNKEKIHPYDFIDSCSIKNTGLVIDSRPVYFASLIENTLGQIELWTVVNSNVKEKLTVSKYSKKVLNEWLKEIEEIYATMGKHDETNMKWVEWLNFKKIGEDANYITYLIKGELNGLRKQNTILHPTTSTSAD